MARYTDILFVRRFYLTVKRLIQLMVVFLLACFCCAKAKAAAPGDKFGDGVFEYTILTNEGEAKVALSDWKQSFRKYGQEIVIPEKVEYEGVSYTVTEITGEKYNGISYFTFSNASKIVIPASVTKIDPIYFEFDTNNGNQPVTIVFNCKASVLSNVKLIEVNSPAIESVIYVPEDEYEEYKTLIDKISFCTFYDTEDVFRRYCGIKIAKIGEEDVMPLGFIYDEASYKVLDEENGTAALICADSNSTCFKNNVYSQPEKVYCNGREFTVTEVEYFAFFSINGAVKLPKTITKLASECFGQYVTKVDLSETKVKTIPTKLFLNYGDNDDSDPIVSEIILPKGCKKIESEAFYRCKELKKITIPKKVTKIGKKAFNKKCKTYYIKGDAIPSGLETLPMKKATIYVKASLFNKAKKALKNRISAGDCVVKKK